MKSAVFGLLVLSSAGAAQSFPDGPGKATFQSVCSLCHSPAAPTGKQFTKAQWEAKVIEMLQEEPDVTADERTAIIEYLAANFKPGGKIYVNLATARDLASLLEVPARDGEAIVGYREEKGLFKTVDDLKKVPGIDAAKIEAKRALLAF